MERLFKKLLTITKNTQGNIPIIILFAVLAIGFLLTGGILPSRKHPAHETGPDVIVEKPPVELKSQSLHLDSIKFITPSLPPATPTPVVILTPTPPSRTCGQATGFQITSVDTEGNCCVADGVTTPEQGCCPGAGQPFEFGPNGLWCDAKPVIYLYPEKETRVAVRIEVPGSITESIPSYPKQGWKNIIAYPNGTLTYNNKIYSELYYEASITPISTPHSGIIVKKENLGTTLELVSKNLGFNAKERKELVAFWVNRLRSLKTPYIFISFFNTDDKHAIDKVIINPKPDTFIEYILYFKPLNNSYEINPPIYPLIPERKGFTAVEWGGIVDW